MTRQRKPILATWTLIAAALLLGLAPAAQATTVCDTTAGAVPFEATLDPAVLNGLLALLGTIPVNTPATFFQLGGVCVDHRVPITFNLISLNLGTSPFTTQTSNGRVQVNLNVPGPNGQPFEIGIDGSDYQAVNCDSVCVVEIPYIGTFSGCDVEAGIARPIFSLFNVGAEWDRVTISQVADTCVLPGCTPVHPLETTTVALPGFDIDATAFGSCNMCVDFPSPFDFLDFCINPCDGIDGLLTNLIRPVIEDAIEAAMAPGGQGLLISVFSSEILMDGCAEIPAVQDCKNPPVAANGMIRAPRDHGLNWALYSLPLVFGIGLTVRARRRGPATPPPAD
jgi:hypothetical protein